MTNINPTNDFSNSGFIPVIESKKLARVLKQYTKFIERNCNKEWEGEIRNQGDTVTISIPDPANVKVAFGTNIQDVCPVANGVEPSKTSLTINNLATYMLKFSDVNQVQSQFNLLDGYNAIAMQKLGDGKDAQVMQDILTDTTVGRVGTPQAPVNVTKDNIYEQLVDIRMTLMSNGALNGDGFYSFRGNNEEMEFLKPVFTCDPTIYGLMLKSNQLTHPTAQGDDIINRGEKYEMAGFEIDVNTVLNNAVATTGDKDNEIVITGLKDKTHVAIAATKMGVTYANQLTKVEKIRDPQCFADIVRGLELYGWLIVHPEAIVACYFALEDAAA